MQFGCINVCLLCVNTEVRRRHQIPYDWSYRWLWEAICVLEDESGFSRRAVTAFEHGTISPAPFIWLCIEQLMKLIYAHELMKTSCIWNENISLNPRQCKFYQEFILFQNHCDLLRFSRIWSTELLNISPAWQPFNEN